MPEHERTPALPPKLAIPVEPFSEAELDDAIYAILDGTPETMPAKVGSFVIDNDVKAEWAMRKLLALTEREDEAIATADDWHAQIDAWLNERLSYSRPRREIFAKALQQFGENQRAADERIKTIALPSGEIKTRKAKQASVHIANEEAVLKWAVKALDTDEYEKAVKTKAKVLVMGLRDLVDVAIGPDGQRRVVHRSTGEVVPGVFVLDPTIEVTVSPKTER